MKSGDINEDGLETEQDGWITRQLDENESERLSEEIRTTE